MAEPNALEPLDGDLSNLCIPEGEIHENYNNQPSDYVGVSNTSAGNGLLLELPGNVDNSIITNTVDFTEIIHRFSPEIYSIPENKNVVNMPIDNVEKSAEPDVQDYDILDLDVAQEITISQNTTSKGRKRKSKITSSDTSILFPKRSPRTRKKQTKREEKATADGDLLETSIEAQPVKGRGKRTKKIDNSWPGNNENPSNISEINSFAVDPQQQSKSKEKVKRSKKSTNKNKAKINKKSAKRKDQQALENNLKHAPISESFNDSKDNNISLHYDSDTNELDGICLSRLKEKISDAVDTINKDLEGETSTVEHNQNVEKDIHEYFKEFRGESDSPICDGVPQSENDAMTDLLQPSDILTSNNETPNSNFDALIKDKNDQSINETFDSLSKLENKSTTKTPQYNNTLSTDLVTAIKNENMEMHTLTFDNDTSLLCESPSKRPRRSRVTKRHYDESEDEDPFANVELSDDDRSNRIKGHRYYSDDEYVPDKRDKRELSSESSINEDSDFDDVFHHGHKNKRLRKKSDTTKKKTINKNQESTIDEEVDMNICTIEGDTDVDCNSDIEKCLQSSVIKVGTSPQKGAKKQLKTQHDEIKSVPSSEMAKEFESFLANKKDLQVKKVKEAKSNIVPLDIPVLNPKELIKTVHSSSQTNSITTKSAHSQTSSLHDLKMIKNLGLSTDQSKNACEFLTNILNSTTELGQLMREKSQDFLQKKIKTECVQDTGKIDNCVKKTFLLLKLAKENITNMEDSLHTQYEQYVTDNELLLGYEIEKKIAPTPPEENDSDCEIIEEPAVSSKLKTVFLNKELSIKITKKTPTNDTKQSQNKKNVIFSGKRATWINESVMVKKVKPAQSFLAQDSRFKKPPDSRVTIHRVRDFFDDYYGKKSLCEPFTSLEWLDLNQNVEVTCNYFVVDQPVNYSSSSDLGDSCSEDDGFFDSFMSNENIPNEFNNDCNVVGSSKVNKQEIQMQMSSPKSLFTLCTDMLHKCMYNRTYPQNSERPNNETRETFDCKIVHANHLNNMDGYQTSNSNSTNTSNATAITETNVPTLKHLCYEKLITCIYNKEEKHLETNASTNETKICSSSMQQSNKTSSNSQLCEYKEFPKSLSKLCLDTLEIHMSTNEHNVNKSVLKENPIQAAFTFVPMIVKQIVLNERILRMDNSIPLDIKSRVKSLKLLCFQTLREHMYKSDIVQVNDEKAIPQKFSNAPKSLMHIAYTNLMTVLDKKVQEDYSCNNIHDTVQESLSNETVSDKMGPKSLCLLSLDQVINSMYSQNHDISNESNETSAEIPATNFMHDVFSDSNCSDGYFENNLLDEDQENDCDYTNELDQEFNSTTEPQFEEIESYCMPVIQNIQSAVDREANNELCAATIKLEPVDALAEVNDSTICIKMEQLEHITTKKEFVDTRNDIEQAHNQNNVFVRSDLGDLPSFEHFLSENNPIFSQSGMRVRRQFEPDSDDENDNPMSLLVPQDSRPVTTTAKKDLLESDSSDEGKKQSDPKKDLVNVKRKRGRPKKSVNNKEISKPDPKDKPVNKEIQIMTRRMREVLRNEKPDESSDSETENLSIIQRKNRTDEKLVKENHSLKNNTVPETAIQCSNVDSTKNSSDKKNEKIKPTGESTKFTGFTAVDQNVTSSYNNYVQGVYDKILPKINSEIDNLNIRKKSDDPPTGIPDEIDDQPHSPLLISNDPVEQVKCEPTFPLYEDDLINTPSVANQVVDKIIVEKPNESVVKDGWSCYPLIGADLKLYQNCSVPLDKLPEAFVETYFEYVKFRDEDRDAEIDKLTNLNSLNRLPQVRDDKPKSKNLKDTTTQDNQTKPTSKDSSATNSVHGDNLDELSLSEDEAETVAEQPPEPAETLQNSIARNSLMNDSDSDDDKPPETLTTNVVIKEENEPAKEGKPKKASTAVKIEDVGPIALTVDKTLTKEIDLLNAPVVLDNEVEYVPNKAPAKDRKKHSSKRKVYDPNKSDDSSSEEEKMWVNTKAKLLNKMRKKLLQDSTLDDAKRSRIVNDFIERHSDCFPGVKGRGRSGKPSKKKFLEAQKQLRVLTNELFNEVYDGDSPIIIGKKTGMSYSRGRRNIRKVLDKKSLAKSTIIANKEEFDRKRRLAAVQNRLRELLGLEESVKAVVINDELCLEYDFNDLQPIVSVHSFFTKVMKAHQCEGVKFMWDACFENVDMVENGHRGGGCILAHCMGLGKTLQVLALLHTVLSHPRLGIKRILVCCPLSTVLNWVDEINKWLGPVDNTVKVFELSKLKKIYERAYQLEDWYKGGGILIIGYELFRSLTTLDPVFDDVRPTIVKKIKSSLLDPGPDVVICDEGHLLKNDCSILAVAMSRVMTRRRIILTGTPMQNNLREYYCMVNFVKPNLLGKYSEYSNRFENPITNGQHRDSREEDIKLMMARTHILHKVLEGCLQRQEVSVLYPYLPKKHEYTVFISLTKVQSDLYKHYLLNFAKKSKQSILRDFHMLQKVWTHPQVLHNLHKERDDRSKLKVEKLEDDLAADDLTAREDLKLPITEAWWLPYLDGGRVLEELASSNKFVTVFRLIDECVQLNDKMLIFSTSLYTMDALEYFLKKIKNWNLGNEYYRLDGSVPAEVRQKWCREFNADNNQKTKLFLISTRAGSLGLNMTAANRVIILDTSWNPAHDVQSIFRVYRFGQKKDCYIYRLVAMGTMEQKIYERAVTKQAVACRVVDEQQIDRHYNMTELTELYRFDELGECVAGGVALGVRDLALLRVVRDTPALHAVYEHDSLLRDTGEQELPEHERAAAWDQFQQEHANKQLQEVFAEISAILPINRPLEVQNALNPAPAQSSVPPPNIPSVSLPIASGSKSLRTYAPHTNEEKTEKDNEAKDPDYNPNEPKKRKVSMPFTVTSGVLAPKVTQKIPNEISQTKLVESLSNVLVDAPPSDVNELARGVTNILKDANATDNIAQKIADYFRVYHSRTAQAKTSDAPPPPPETAQTNKQDNATKSLIADIERSKKAVVLVENIFANAPEMVTRTTHDVESSIPLIKISKHKMKNLVIKSYDHKKNDVVVKKYESKLRVLDVGKINAPSTSSIAASTSSDADNAIVLSDDDECVVTNAAPEAVPQREEEKVPLHPKILINPNFVKLVASEYEKGNPMLDSGAALKAAEYSTATAYADVTTKNLLLTSGPLYQIAVNLLGMTSLRKLWHTHKETTKNKPGPASSKTGPNFVKIVPTLARKPAIVPVGIMKSANAFTGSTTVGSGVASNDECILPDDSGITAPASSTMEAVASARVKLKQILGKPFTEPKLPATNQAPPPTVEAAAIVPETATAQQSQKRVLLRRVTDLQNIQGMLKKTREKTYGQITDILNSQLSAPIVPVTAPNVAGPANLNSQTICLDSDEETDPPNRILNATPVANPAQAPKVIKLTKVDPNKLNHALPPVITLMPGSSLQNLQFNQTMATTSDGQNMFIIQGPSGNHTIQMQPMGAMVPMQSMGRMLPMQSMGTIVPMQSMGPMMPMQPTGAMVPQQNLFTTAGMGVPQHSNVPTVQKNMPLPNLAPLSTNPSNQHEPSPVQITMVNNEGPVECEDEMILPDIGPTPSNISQQINNNNATNAQHINSQQMTGGNTNKNAERIVQSGASVHSVFDKPSASDADEMSRNISLLNNSDSDRSRSASPADPMSVLNNVVRITADMMPAKDSAPPTMLNLPAKRTLAKQTNNKPPQTDSAPSTISKKTVAKPASQKQAQGAGPNILKKALTGGSNSILKTNVDASTTKDGIKKIITDVVDLTDLEPDTIPNSSIKATIKVEQKKQTNTKSNAKQQQTTAKNVNKITPNLSIYVDNKNNTIEFKAPIQADKQVTTAQKIISSPHITPTKPDVFKPNTTAAKVTSMTPVTSLPSPPNDIEIDDEFTIELTPTQIIPDIPKTHKKYTKPTPLENKTNETKPHTNSNSNKNNAPSTKKPDIDISVLSDSDSDNDESRSPSPFDPASILNNVVQIQADSYEPSPAENKPKQSPKQLVNNITVVPPKKLEHTKGPAPKGKSNPTSKVKKEGTKSSSNAEVGRLSFKNSLLEILRKKKQMEKDKKDRNTLDMVDLTEDFKSASRASNVKSETKTNKKMDFKAYKGPVKNEKIGTPKKETIAAVTGTSKTIMINAKGKALAKTETKPSIGSGSGSSPKVIQITNISAQKSATKRKAVVNTPPADVKKKKNQFQSLEDFSFDDLEDIIELE